MLYFLQIAPPDPLDPKDLANSVQSQILSNWLPYSQIFILLLACAAILSKFTR